MKVKNIDRKKSSRAGVVARDERDIQVENHIGNESNNQGESDIGHENCVTRDESDVVRDERDFQRKIDITQLVIDLGLGISIMVYHINVRDEVQRLYIQMDSCQPSKHKFPLKKYEKSSLRHFQSSWFHEFPSWLEYSIERCYNLLLLLFF